MEAPNKKGDISCANLPDNNENSAKLPDNLQEASSGNGNTLLSIDRYFFLLLMVSSFGFWLFLPFIAVAKYQVGKPPTAFQIIMGSFDLWGNVLETYQFWIALGVLIGIVISTLCLLNNSKRGLIISSGLSTLLLSWALFEAIMSEYAFYKMLGLGFWILLLFFCIIFVLSIK